MMPRRSLLIGSLGFGAVTIGVAIGAFATGIKQDDGPRPQVGTCAAYSGFPAGDEREKPGLVFIPGGGFMMGSERHRPEERFSHLVRVDGFWIDRHEVTNAQF